VAAAAVGRGVAEAHAHGGAGFVGCEFKAFDVDAEVFSAVFFGHGAHAVCEVVAEAAPVCYVVECFFDVVGSSEFEFGVEHAALFEFHCESDGASGADGVNAEESITRFHLQIAARSLLRRLEPKRPIVSNSGPFTFLPSISTTRPQRIGQLMQPMFLTRRVSANVSPLILSACSYLPLEKFAVGRPPATLSLLRKLTVPYFGSDSPVTGFSLRSFIQSCTAFFEAGLVVDGYFFSAFCLDGFEVFAAHDGAESAASGGAFL